MNPNIRPFLKRWMLIPAGILVFYAGFAARNPNDNYFEISKNMDIFGKVYREINAYYVDEVDPGKFMKTGIDAMLATLDPFTNYITASEIEDFKFQTSGHYSGIGASISRRSEGKSVIITEVYESFPAQMAGILPGDEILKIDDTQIQGSNLDIQDIRNLLRGQPKTGLTLTIKRPGESDPRKVAVTRDDIQVKSVPWSGIVADNIGYIQLTSFSMNATADIKAAFETIRKDNPGLKGLVLDLRDNPGGLLMEAVNISNLFVNRGEKIVETRGRADGSLKIYQAQENALDTVLPVVVLINGSSASASEIVSGVMQDLDRGVVIGQRSYGKGLVQNSRPLSYNTQLKLTTAKYYTPSGRCIQAIDYSHRREDGTWDKIPDSLMTEFKTRRGRSVYDGGGIAPDIEVTPPNYHRITQEMVAQFVIFDFATEFRKNNPTIAPAKTFKITDDIYNEFIQFVSNKKFEYTTKAEKELKELQGVLEKEGYWEKVRTQVATLEDNLKEGKKNDIKDYRKEIERILKAEIVSRYYYKVGRLESSFEDDPEVSAAVQLLNDPARYKSILKR
jgi:carboxyl-terminal processing protease